MKKNIIKTWCVAKYRFGADIGFILKEFKTYEEAVAFKKGLHHKKGICIEPTYDYEGIVWED